MVQGHTIEHIPFIRLVATVMFCIIMSLLILPQHARAAQVNQLFISEVQVSNEEFIEIYNPSDVDISLAGWRIMYKGGGTSELEVYSFNSEVISSHNFIVLSRGYVTPLNTQVAMFSRQLANTSGYLVLYDPLNQVVDTVGWGADAGKSQGSPAISPSAGVSIQRCFINGLIALSDPRDNSQEFAIYTEMTPGNGVICSEELPEPPDVCTNLAGPQYEVPDGYILSSNSLCEVAQKCIVEISEISAQPNFEGKEYVEVYNPSTEIMYLTLCKLSINGGTERIIAEKALQPGEYFAAHFNNGTIRNSAGTIALVTSTNARYIFEYPSTNTGQSVNYDALGVPIITNYPTPSAINIMNPTNEPKTPGVTGSLADCGPGKYRNPETNRCRNLASTTTLTPCAPNQERNPDTNRCRKIGSSAANTLKPCAADQERNPETNRCRKKGAGTTTLKPCAPDQFRNPETNRCKKIAGSKSNLKPCAPNQERNPETNRCRKVASSVSGTPLEGAADPAAISPFQYKTPLFGLLGTALLGYGAYEYRSDMRNFFQKLRDKRLKGRPPG